MSLQELILLLLYYCLARSLYNYNTDYRKNAVILDTLTITPIYCEQWSGFDLSVEINFRFFGICFILLCDWFGKPLYYQWEAKQKHSGLGQCTPTFSRALRSLHSISLQTDRFMGVFVSAMFDLNNYFVLAYDAKVKISCQATKRLDNTPGTIP